MIECWCISIIFGNDLLVKPDNWFNKPFLGNTVSGLRRRRREGGGLLENFSSCNECLTLQDTDTSASEASSNVPHALCKVRQDYRVHVITKPTATLHKLFVYEIFIAVASGSSFKLFRHDNLSSRRSASFVWQGERQGCAFCVYFAVFMSDVTFVVIWAWYGAPEHTWARPGQLRSW